MYKNSKEIDEWLWSNYKTLANPEALFSRDDNNDKKENFTDDKLKVLCVFLTPASSRACSNTYNALWTLCKAADKTHELKDPNNQVVVDACYFPEEENMSIFEANNIPYIFGQVTHETIDFYDVVIMS